MLKTSSIQRQLPMSQRPTLLLPIGGDEVEDFKKPSFFISLGSCRFNQYSSGWGNSLAD